jgi:hypothetical protein
MISVGVYAEIGHRTDQFIGVAARVAALRPENS